MQDVAISSVSETFDFDKKETSDRGESTTFDGASKQVCGGMHKFVIRHLMY